MSHIKRLLVPCVHGITFMVNSYQPTTFAPKRVALIRNYSWISYS